MWSLVHWINKRVPIGENNHFRQDLTCLCSFLLHNQLILNAALLEIVSSRRSFSTVRPFSLSQKNQQRWIELHEKADITSFADGTTICQAQIQMLQRMPRESWRCDDIQKKFSVIFDLQYFQHFKSAKNAKKTWFFLQQTKKRLKQAWIAIRWILPNQLFHSNNAGMFETNEEAQDAPLFE